MSDNWVVQNLENALAIWNEKLAEIWQLITQSPETFKGGTIWNVVLLIHDTMQAIGLALLVLFFVVGVVKTCGSFAEIKRPEAAVKLFIRFALAKAAVTYGLELMMALFTIVQGVISSIMSAAGMGAAQETVLPAEIVTAIESCGFWESIPLWAVALIGGLFITILSFVMVLTVYGRFFRLYIYTAIAPIPLSTFAGEPSQQVGKSFLKADKEDNRLRLYFDEKPSEEQRSKLKCNGFKWAPSVGAWQRQLNDNAIHAAARMDFLRPESGENPTAIQPKRPVKNAPERG